MSFLLPSCEEIPPEALPASETISSPKSDVSASEPFISKGTVEHSSNCEFLLKISGPAEGEGEWVLQPPHFFRNFKELLRKRCFQPPPPPPPTLSHYSAPPTFKVAPRALDIPLSFFLEVVFIDKIYLYSNALRYLRTDLCLNADVSENTFPFVSQSINNFSDYDISQTYDWESPSLSPHVLLLLRNI